MSDPDPTVLTADPAELSPRHLEVLDRLERRVTIKVIAAELGLSRARVCQHVSELKKLFGVNSLTELVERYRAWAPAEGAYTKGLYTKNQLPGAFAFADQPARDDEGELVLADAQTFTLQPPWARIGEPEVVPRVLDGGNAVLLRLAAVAIILFLVIASLVLALSAAGTLTDVVRPERQTTS